MGIGGRGRRQHTRRTGRRGVGCLGIAGVGAALVVLVSLGLGALGLLPEDDGASGYASATGPVAGSVDNIAGAGSGDAGSTQPLSEKDALAGGTPTVFRSVVDGDTIRTDLGTVRLIGIDTPERGECGYADAAAVIRGLLTDGDSVVLVHPPGQRDADRYQRLLRYVYTEEGSDVGLTQLRDGNAVARYDSTDGYPEHPHEADYREAQTASLDSAGAVISTRCGGGVGAAGAAGAAVPPAASAPGAPSPDSAGATAGTGAVTGGWWAQYPSCAALKRNTVGHPVGPFALANTEEAAIYDWFANGTGHRGDGDGDGLACE